MALRFGVISADDHVLETPDLWTKRLSKARFGDKIPQIAKQSAGTERWVVDGKVRQARALAATGALSTNRFDEPQRWSAVAKEAYDPAARAKALDKDQVDAQVLYPSAAGLSGEAFCAIENNDLELACVQAYNDWMIEVWGKSGGRFIPQCLIPMYSVVAAAREMARAVKMGHRGVVMAPIPWHLNKKLAHINDKSWDPIWAAAQDLDVPICWHSGSDPTIMLEIYDGFNPAMSHAFDSVRRPVSHAIVLANFLLGGIPERFPKVKVVFASAGIAWVPFQLENSDHEWDRSMLEKEGMHIRPTEIFHRQCYVSTWVDNAAIKIQRDFIGIENILWQSEFPLETSTYPNSAEYIKRNFQGVPKADMDKVLFGNTAMLYKVPM